MERIILGSADVYIQAFDGSTVPVTADICKPENLMAYISGGASVEYKPSFYTAKDDTGKKSKTIVTEEEVTLKTGIMTFLFGDLEHDQGHFYKCRNKYR